MIILGDVASPNAVCSQHILDFFETNRTLLKSESILFNLEGLIADEQDLSDNSPILFNHSTVVNVFKNYPNKIAALANNHTLDLPHLLKETKVFLYDKGFHCVGSGNVIDNDLEVTEVTEDGMQIFIINACWEFLLYHQSNKNTNTHVKVIEELEILTLVKRIKTEYPTSKIVTYFHWSFDLEILPSPSYRVFSKDLIDAGVSLVVGGHSHCVQGGEKYKDGNIVYGLGNFFIPSGVYANGKLKFPPMSDLGWVLKWDVKSNTLKNIWIDTSSNYLRLIRVEDFNESLIMQKFSGFCGLSDGEYVTYFKKNRRKNKLNPVFFDYKKSLSNAFKMKALKTRAKAARMAAKFNLIKWQN
jgi:hypothetical protein